MREDVSGWEAAAALRWKLASGALLDPFSMVGAVAAAWACQRAASAWVADDSVRAAALPILVLLGLALISAAIASTLLYDRRENDLLRSLPLGPAGFLHLTRRELGWWTVVPRLLGACAVWGGSDAAAAAVVFVASWGAREAGLSLALAASSAGRRWILRASVLALAAGAVALRWSPPAVSPPDSAPLWAALLLGGALASCALGPARLWVRFSASRLSEAAARPATRGWAWGPALDRLAPLPGPLRARLLRDLLLLVRGQDVRALVLLALSPLACLYLVDELARSGSAQALSWRVSSAAALGGAAVAYAGGPAVHLLRTRGLSWERVAPRPGRRHLTAALTWSLGFALLHGAAVLATVALAHGGRHAHLVPALILPVLGLEAAMAHFVVAFVSGASDGRRVHGEGTIALMLPVVALGVALVGLLLPWAVPLYFVVTANMVRDGVRRLETMEVAW